MYPVATKNATHIFNPPENWDQEKDGPCGALQVRRQFYEGSQRGIIELISTWKPTDAELALLNAGGSVELSILSSNQPPVGLRALPPDPQPATYSKPVTINEEGHGL